MLAGLLAAAAVAVLGVGAWFALRPEPGTPVAPSATSVAPSATPVASSAASPVAPPAPAAAPVASAASAPAKPAAQAAQAPQATTADPGRPSFDTVYVSPQGNAVVAGRAAPGAEVSLRENGTEIGRAQANARGEWVVTPTQPIAPGGQELSIAAIGPNGAETKGDAQVALLIPDRGKPAAASPAPGQPPAPQASAPAAPSAPMAVLVPSEGAPRVLQAAPGASGPQARLGIDLVDYDTAGQIRFAGAAPPGATLRGYVDNAPVGDAVADAQGRWTLAPKAAVSAGDHQLRIDQIGPNGAVLARAGVPFQRAEPAAVAQQAARPGPADDRIIVQPHQNLWRIARAAYGRGARYTVIHAANRDQIRDPKLIYPGQVFTVPAAPEEAKPAGR